ncbi:uncharacterized protein [Chelonus insularis]|uniref:uncharacterized protein n=1 Tax=Chelonus insularis TaxID=460826 RepID=UPI00158C2E31|nr:uncharacterized protein LOC118072007 [Chelonus insularis]
MKLIKNTWKVKIGIFLNMNNICAIILIFLCVVSGNKVSEFCHGSGEIMRCECVGNEELELSSSLNLDKLTKLLITSCTSVHLYSISLGNSNAIRDLIIHNVSDSLTFEPIVLSKKMGKFELSRIGRIPLIDHDTFISISSIESFTIEDSKIGKFDEQFTNINVDLFILKNVAINHSVGINFSNEGKILKIVNSTIRNMDGNINFAFFGSIEIINSTFDFRSPGDMTIEGFSVSIVDSVFTNVRINLIARGNALIKNNCADGKSSLRVTSIYVNSNGNKLPTEIIYTQKGTKAISFQNKNNIVCIAGNCKCPKSITHNSYDKLHVNVYLGVVLLLILYGL